MVDWFQLHGSRTRVGQGFHVGMGLVVDFGLNMASLLGDSHISVHAYAFTHIYIKKEWRQGCLEVTEIFYKTEYHFKFQPLGLPPCGLDCLCGGRDGCSWGWLKYELGCLRA